MVTCSAARRLAPVVDEVLARLRWIASDFGPAMGEAVRGLGGVPLKPMVAKGLAMGDEMHQRNIACTGLMVRALAPALARTVSDGAKLATILDFVSGNDQFFLNIAMGMAKAVMAQVAPSG